MDASDPNGMTALMAAAVHGMADVVEALISAGNNQQR